MSKKSKSSGESGLTFLHKLEKQSIKDGVKMVEEEMITEGSRGIMIKYFSNNKGEKEKIVITGKNGEFSMRTMKNGESDEKKLDKKEFLAVVGKNRNLAFAKAFAKTQEGGELLFGGAKKRSKKGSKKGSKKSSKK